MDAIEMLSVISGFVAAAAAAMAALVACNMLRLERFRETNRTLLLKHASEVEHVQKLIASFARIAALDSAQWNDRRNQETNESILEMQFHISILEALNTRVSANVGRWTRAESPDGKTIPQIIYYQIGYLHSTGHDGRTDFFRYKMEGLKTIQDEMYSEMTKE